MQFRNFMSKATLQIVGIVIAGSLLATACGSRLPPASTVSSGEMDSPAATGGTPVASGSTESASGDALAAPSSAPSTPSGAGANTPKGSTAAGAGAAPTGAGAAPAGGPAGAPVAGDPPPLALAGPSDQGVTDTEIRIGLDAPLSGFAAFMGEEVLGATDAYFQMVNAQGGINGRKITLVSYDDRIDFSQMLINARKLYEEDKVFALVVTIADPVLDYVTRNNIPTYVLGISAPPFESKYPTTFPMIGNALLGTHAMMAGLLEKGVVKPGMRVAVAYDTFLDASPYVPFIKEGWEKSGAEVVSMDPFTITNGDCTPLVLKMKQLNIDYWDLVSLGWVLCLAAAQRQNWRPNVGWGGWMSSIAALTVQAGPYSENMWTMNLGDLPDGSPRFSEPQPAHKMYAAALKKYHPNLAVTEHMNSPATLGYWVAAQVLVKGLQAQTGAVTRDGVIKWTQALSDYDPGVTPPIKAFRPDCKTGTALAWVAQWHWEGNNISYVNRSGYNKSPYEEMYGGECYVTKLSNRVAAK